MTSITVPQRKEGVHNPHQNSVLQNKIFSLKQIEQSSHSATEDVSLVPKRSQEFTKEAAKCSREMTIGGSAKLSDVVLEASERSKEIVVEASKRSKEIVAKQTTSQIPAAAISQLVDSSSTGSTQTKVVVATEADLERFGVTNESREFVKGITLNTFRDFPLQDDSERSSIPTVSNVRQDLTEFQERHAKLFLTSVKEISKLRYELCPRVMRERKFWRTYFLLVNSHISPFEKRYIKEKGSIHGEFMPVGADCRVVLSFNLLNADPRDWIYDWDFQELDDMLVSPIVQALRPITDISVESQVLYHTSKSLFSGWDEKQGSYIAILTGGEVISEERGLTLDAVQLDMLGTAKKVAVSIDDTIVIHGGGDKKLIEERCEKLRTAMDKSTVMFDKEKAQEGLSKLTGGVAVFKVEQNLFEWLKGHLLKLKGTLMLATPDDVAAIQQMRLKSSGKSKMTCDHNGFRKLLIVLSRSGKLYALHTGDGRIVWSFLVNALRKSETCENPNGLKIHQWQVPHHHAMDENPSHTSQKVCCYDCCIDSPLRSFVPKLSM